MPMSFVADGMSHKGHDHSPNSRGVTPSSGSRSSDQSETVASRQPSNRSKELMVYNEKPDAYDLQRIALEEQLGKEISKLGS